MTDNLPIVEPTEVTVAPTEIKIEELTPEQRELSVQMLDEKEHEHEHVL